MCLYFLVEYMHMFIPLSVNFLLEHLLSDAVLFVMYQTITSLLVVRSEVEIHDTVPFLDVIMLLK